MSNDSSRLLEALTRAQLSFIATEDVREVFEQLLAEVLSVTSSEYGFIGEVYHNGQQPFLKSLAITNLAWNDVTRRYYDEMSASGLEFYNLDTLFGAVLRTGELVISNDPAHDPRAGGIPEGHPPLKAFLGLPFHSRDGFVGMVGVANKPGGYSTEDVEFLRPLSTTCVAIIEGMRSRRERQRLQEELALSEERLRLILKSTIDGVVVIDEQGRVTSANSAVTTIFGYTEEELVGQDVSILAAPHYGIPHSQRLQLYAERGTSTLVGSSREVDGRRKDGTIFPMSLGVSEAWNQGERYFTGIVRDLSASKEAQKHLVSSAKMASLGEMAAGVAHEINNPLEIINGYANVIQVLLKQAQHRPEALEQIGHSAERIQNIIHRIATIVRGLRNFSRDATGDPMVLTPVSQIIEDTLEFCRARFANHGIEIRVEAPEGLMLHCRATEISQVLLNLLSNAFDALGELPAGAPRWVEVVARVDGDALCLEVADSGPGVPEAVRSRLMEPFFTTKLQGKGTGLGLSICDGIVHAHGGRLSLESYDGVTRFVARFPLMPRE